MHILIGSLALFASLQAIAGFAVWVRLFTELSSPLRATTVMGFALLVSI